MKYPTWQEGNAEAPEHCFNKTEMRNTMTKRALSTTTVLKAIKSFTPVLIAIVGFDIIASSQSLSLVGCTGVCTVNKSPDPGALDSTGGQFAQVQQSVAGGSFQITVAWRSGRRDRLHCPVFRVRKPEQMADYHRTRTRLRQQ